jgi:hypothetical protein
MNYRHWDPKCLYQFISRQMYLFEVCSYTQTEASETGAHNLIEGDYSGNVESSGKCDRCVRKKAMKALLN